MKLKNRIEDILHYNDGQVILTNIMLEVTNACNNKCIFCANQKMSRQIGNLDISLAENILQQAYILGCRQVGLYATGESLLYTQLGKLINLAKKIGFEYIYLTTNGLLLNITKFIELQKAGLDSIKISFNAIDKATYELIHGVNAFTIVDKNLSSVFKYKKDNNLPIQIYVSYISTKYTNNIQEIENFFRDKCDELVIIPVRNQCGYMPETQFLIDDLDIQWLSSKRNLPCKYVFNTACVTCEGYLTACCTDFQNYLVYADLNETSLANAWQNEVITQLRKEHLEKKLSNNLCAQCIYNQNNIFPLIEKYATVNNISKISDEIITRIKELDFRKKK